MTNKAPRGEAQQNNGEELRFPYNQYCRVEGSQIVKTLYSVSSIIPRIAFYDKLAQMWTTKNKHRSFITTNYHLKPHFYSPFAILCL